MKANSTREKELNEKLFKKTWEILKSQGVEISYVNLVHILKSKWNFLATIIRFGQMEGYKEKGFGQWGVKKQRPAALHRPYLTKPEREEYEKIDPKDRKTKLAYLTQSYKISYEKYKKFFDYMEFQVEMIDSKGKKTSYKTLREAAAKTKIQPILIYTSCSKKTVSVNGKKFNFILDVDKEQERKKIREERIERYKQLKLEREHRNLLRGMP